MNCDTRNTQTFCYSCESVAEVCVNTNGISIASAVMAGLSNVTDRQTDKETDLQVSK